MAQTARIRVSTVSETKMFAKKMHRLVKKMQENPADSLELITDMTRKRGENLSFPIEIETEAQWTAILKRDGLVVADVYSGWSGPCTSMFSILRKLKLDTNDDRLILAAANADHIEQLAPFRNQSEPCWLFLGGGKPVNVLRGSNAPKLVRNIKSEFQHELQCIEGKAKRNLISIKFEASRREKAVNEAIALNALMVLEEEEKRAREMEKAKSPTPALNDTLDDEDRMTEEEKYPDGEQEIQDTGDENDEENVVHKESEEEVPEIDEAMLEMRKMMEDSNIRLRKTLKSYTVLAIQSYLIETGAVTEIKDRLAKEFKLIRERYINLNDDGARKLFGIPSEVPDPNPFVKEDPTSEIDDTHTQSELCDTSAVEDDNEKTISAASPIQLQSEELDDKTESERVRTASQGAEGHSETEESQDEKEKRRRKREKTPIRMLPVIVPEVLIGDTLILLLECLRGKNIDDNKSKEEGDEKEEEALVDLCDADYYLLRHVGSEDYEIVIETQPESLHAMYGQEKYVSGVWCPRIYEEKRFVMLNYFPQFVTEMLVPPIPDPPNDTDDNGNHEEHEDKKLNPEK